MRVLITGSAGLVGRATVRHCAANGDEVFARSRDALDISDADAVEEIVGECRPDAIINCAAWTDVDGCESDPARATTVNALGPENLARAARNASARLLTISTDYVFDGTKGGFYTQRDDPNPESVYAASKLAGERRAQFASARTIVVRTGYVFGAGGRNFLSTVIDRAGRGEQLQVISDACGTPTYAPHLAARLRLLAEMDLPGVFHVVNSGDGATFEEFTREALRLAELSAEIHPVTMNSLSRPARRPMDSRLECLVSRAIGLPAMPAWQDALKEFIDASSHQKQPL